MSYEAEQRIISALFTDQGIVSNISDKLFPEMFQSEILGKIYKNFIYGYTNNKEITIEYLCQKISDERITQAEIQEEISQAVLNWCTSLEAKTNAEVVINDYKSRRLNNYIHSMIVTPNNYEEQMCLLSEEIDLLTDKKSEKSKTLSKISELYKDQYFKPKEIDALNIGFDRLDDLLGGLEGGDVIVIGARPAVGKSAFVTQITSNLASKGKKVGFYNLEMQDKQVYERFVVNQSGIGLTRLRRAVAFLGDEEERFNKANEVIGKADNIVITTGSKSVNEIRIESKHAEYDIIIIDYLQLVKADTSYRGNRYAEVGAISKAIKALAMELNIPIIALSQLNRGSEMRDEKEPMMSELREAGDIEQDASVIMLLWNLNKDNPSKKGCKVEKNRQGKTGKVVLNFNGDLMRFEESSEDVKTASQWREPVPEDDCPFE